MYYNYVTSLNATEGRLTSSCIVFIGRLFHLSLTYSYILTPRLLIMYLHSRSYIANALRIIVARYSILRHAVTNYPLGFSDIGTNLLIYLIRHTNILMYVPT